MTHPTDHLRASIVYTACRLIAARAARHYSRERNELAHLALLVARLPRAEVDALELLFAGSGEKEEVK